MKRKRILILTTLIAGLGFVNAFVSCNSGSEKPIKVLILSGSNNHDWKKTTPYLERIFHASGLFAVDVTEKPDTLSLPDFKRYDVVVSNWNSFPEMDVRWPERTEGALLSYLKMGGGLVTFHSSSSAFYGWPEFKEIRTAEWVMDSTWHGKNSVNRVIIHNEQHPVTKGMSGFLIYDELWVNAGSNPKFEVLGSVTNTEMPDGENQPQPGIMVTDYGKGRVFHTILGHDVPAIRNTGFQTLLTRGTEWAATGKVLQPLPRELQRGLPSGEKFGWLKTDTSFALLSGENIVWQYNFNTKHGRPFFHPIYVGNNKITCVSPDDHIWHLGQWFCWKYINGVNYWEYKGGTYTSEGTTGVQKVDIATNPDFSATINLELAYHPGNGEPVLSELRTIKVAAPQPNGNLWMDYCLEFKAIADTVVLDRTPIEGEPGGKSWGGYSGLSIRFNQDFTQPRFISAWGDNENINGQQGDWLYMGFTGLDGQKTGSQIMVKPGSPADGCAWYSTSNTDLPFYYFSPAVLYYKPLSLLKGQELKLNYRILHLAGEPDFSLLEYEFIKYQNTTNKNE